MLEQSSPIAGLEKVRSSFALKLARNKMALPLPLRRPAAFPS